MKAISLSQHEALALAHGRLAQIRRFVDPQPEVNAHGHLMGEWLTRPLAGLLLPKVEDIALHCPYGEAGAVLRVREEWKFGPTDPRCLLPHETAGSLMNPLITYRADNATRQLHNTPMRGTFNRWRSSNRMPLAASRSALRLVSVGVQRLQDITEGDAVACGYTRPACGPDYTLSKRWAYCLAWNEAMPPLPFDANPFVWVLKVEVA